MTDMPDIMGAGDIAFPHLGIYLKDVPKSFTVFGFSIALYGMIIGIGIILGVLWAAHEAKRTGQDPERYWDFSLYAIILCIIGSRIYYVAFSWDYYKDNLLEIFNLRRGGLAIYGTVIMAFVTAFVYTRVKKMSLALFMDTGLQGLLIGQIIGRWGNFTNREAFGQYTDNLFAMRLPIEAVRSHEITESIRAHITDAVNYIQVHPTFLYESLWNLGVFLLIQLYKPRKRFDGELTLFYLGGYGLGRFWVESLRTDQLLIPHTTVPVSQMLAGALFLLALVSDLVIRARLNTKDSGGKQLLSLILVFVLASCALTSCAPPALKEVNSDLDEQEGIHTEHYISFVDEEPDTVDFQCTTIYYTVALNVFDRLVETVTDASGNAHIVPSLAESWEISSDGLRYLFRLRENVRFSNGSYLTSSDVQYTFVRLLTHPDSVNGDIVEIIQGADRLRRGVSKKLEGFRVLNDLEFEITLEKPFSAFLACLSQPGASILDRETVSAVTDQFGKAPSCTIGTGSFILKTWEPGKGMVFTANPNCWEGRPLADGLDMRFIADPETEQLLFENGDLDILDLENVGDAAEFFYHGDIYQDRLRILQQIGTTYIALNESIAPLNDVRVRKALQLALNRQMLLDAACSGRGVVENGIIPTGIAGHNPKLQEIPYDPEKAAFLLKEAGLEDGFDLRIAVRASSARLYRDISEMAASMWKKVGVRAEIQVFDENEFMEKRKNGALACYAATWDADYDDPENFFTPFFSNKENSRNRSLCYSDEAVMHRVMNARSILNETDRMEEYRALEKKIVQEDSAWIPLFSRQHGYVLGERVEDFGVSWNGLLTTRLRDMSLKSEYRENGEQ